MSIQDNYAVRQTSGHVGSPARVGQSYGEQLWEASADIKPGAACVINGDKIEVATDGALAIGIVSFNYDIINDANGIASYKAGDHVSVATDGAWYVEAGEDIAKGDALIFNDATGKWIKGATVATRFTAQDSGSDGDVIAVQVQRV